MSTNFCPNCFSEGFIETCAHCGYIALSQAGNHLILPPGTVLNNRYMIGRALGAGGFGITYLAKDQRDGTLVAVKEYLPNMIAMRDVNSKTVYASSNENREIFTHGLEVFNKEAAVLKKFDGYQSIVQVKECFEANGTAYFSMEYLDGVNLKALMRSMGGQVTLALGMEIFHTTAQTLQLVHEQGLLHRDVSPENIFITRDAKIKLIDFGATRFYVGEKSRSLSVIIKPGFAPPEQYASRGNQGPWTDVYALCATIYNAITGDMIPDAPDRLGGASIQPVISKLPTINPAISAAIERGLRLDYRTRPQSIKELLGDVNRLQASAPIAAPQQQMRGTPYLQMVNNASDKWILPKNMQMTIGRSSEKCNIVIDDPNISRVHCSVIYNEKSSCFYITDFSSNGTFVEGGRLEQGKIYALNEGDTFYLLSRNFTMKVGLE
ncbi:FHA domain-containing serine/threonine-protein kinase [Christensenellaceae bacterium OttesenSCG-928-M15]|nr:FHA domain-containing serine/threonine-protein kinase [Christensenellaceae bacterium OttesenSCG-928-M15]